MVLIQVPQSRGCLTGYRLVSWPTSKQEDLDPRGSLDTGTMSIIQLDPHPVTTLLSVIISPFPGIPCNALPPYSIRSSHSTNPYFRITVGRGCVTVSTPPLLIVPCHDRGLDLDEPTSASLYLLTSLTNCFLLMPQ